MRRVPESVVPTGAIVPFAGSAYARTDYLLCDGSEYSRTEFADLFAVIGTTYGAGDGSTTFNVPNLQGRVPVGRDVSQTEFDTLGEMGGAKTHTLSTDELPSHSHSINHDHASFSSGSVAAHSHTVRFGGADNNILVRWAPSTEGLQAAGTGNRATFSNATAEAAGGHSHTINVPAYSGSSGAVGSGSAHNNLQPYIVMNYLIKT
jgi:microcystin-dependent protein